MAAAGFVYPMSGKLTKFEIVTESGCWIWMGASDKDGYGIIAGSHKGERWRMRAHRASYEYFVAPILDGLDVLHRCGVPSCINPYHLFVGTHQVNMSDAVAKGRLKAPSPKFGSQNPMFGKVGALNPFYGKRHSEETKMKISKANRGQK